MVSCSSRGDVGPMRRVPGGSVAAAATTILGGAGVAASTERAGATARAEASEAVTATVTNPIRSALGRTTRRVAGRPMNLSVDTVTACHDKAASDDYVFARAGNVLSTQVKRCLTT
jgi:hypothetical protein